MAHEALRAAAGRHGVVEDCAASPLHSNRPTAQPPNRTGVVKMRRGEVATVFDSCSNMSDLLGWFNRYLAMLRVGGCGGWGFGLTRWHSADGPNGVDLAGWTWLDLAGLDLAEALGG